MGAPTQPMPPPLRTNTAFSQTSTASSQLSPTTTTTSDTPSSSRTSASSTETPFFGAITQRLRDRSRSRSRGAASRPRPKSPTPPASVAMARPHREPTGRIASDPWRGRHSNEWLFGGMSVRDTLRDLATGKKS